MQAAFGDGGHLLADLCPGTFLNRIDRNPYLCGRLLDSAPIRETIRQSGTEVALILSDGIYSETVLNGHTSLRPQDFRKVTVRNKEFAADAWIWLPHGDVHRLVLASQEISGDEPGSAAERPVAASGTQADAPVE